MFGTDGIRDTFGTGWLTPTGIYAIGHALAQHLVHNHDESEITIAIATDTRSSRHIIQKTLDSALALYPFTIMDYGILPTSALVTLLEHNEHTCGIMITASHNTYQDNGIKIFGPNGTKISEHDEECITTSAYQAYEAPQQYEKPRIDKAQFATFQPETSGLTQYYNFVLNRCCPSLENIRIVLDTAAGACHHIAPHIFKACGADVRIMSPQPNGYNINYKCGSTKPEHLQQHVIDENAHIGFAFDGDGDRVIAINHHGQIKDGDDILAILTQHPDYHDISYIVGTHMTNMGLEVMLAQHHQQLIRTRVGDKHVAAELERKHEKLGGEPSGHIRLNDLHTTGDGILTALRVLEVITQTGDWSMPSFEKYTQITYTIPVHQRLSLEERPLSDILSTYQRQLDGRIYARYSGTEPVMRLMIESSDTEHAHTVGEHVHTAITQAIGNVCKQ